MNPFEDRNYLNRKFFSGKNLSFEEIYADSKDESVNVEDEREPVSTRILTAIILVPFLVLATRLFLLQSVRGSEYKAMAEGNKLRATPTYAPRGLVMDSAGKIIVQNMPNFELDVVPADLLKDKSALDDQIGTVARILNVDLGNFTNQVYALDKKSYQTQNLISSITKEQALILLGKQATLPGFTVENNPIRDYRDPMMFAPLIGYTGKITEAELSNHKNDGYLLNDYIGKTGLEVEYENYLRGVSGQKQVEIDAQGNLKKALADIPPESGDNIKLNIDYDLEKVLYDSLHQMLTSRNLKRGAGVATNPKTGQVLAMVSFPSYDNSMFAHGISQTDYTNLINDPNHPLINRAIAGQYPPGSTVKPLMAVAALTEGVVKPDTRIVDDGVIRVGAFTFYGYNHTGLGVMDVYSAIARSSDIYFYTVGGGRAGTSIQGLGPDRIAAWYHKFQIGAPLGIDLPGEKSGLVPDPAWKERVKNEKWFLGDTYHYSIGQGDLLVTPLQINSWTATIANGGTVMKPYILNEVLDKDNNVIKKMEPQTLARDQFDPGIIKIVQDGMRQTVTVGTAQSLKSVGMAVSGKTGSAQFDPVHPTLTHAWFTSYAPSEDPQIALTVLVESSGEGGTYSVPVTKDVYNWWVENRLKK
jgi:penicillin-binding protein 2